MLAILSDIHSNVHALDAVLAECRRRGVTDYCCLGDVVGYGAYPAECVQRIRDLACPVVQGNHDAYVASGRLDSDVSPLAKAGVEYSISKLSKADREWLGALPYVYRWKENVTLVHSSLNEPEEWHYVRICRMAEDSFEYQKTPLCFFGHTHVSQIFRRHGSSRPEPSEQNSVTLVNGDLYLVNPGSVGQPRNGMSHAQFAVYDPEKKKVELAHTAYDVEAAARGIREAGLPVLLGERLREGY
jgi:predicted phosphodiesterase